MIFGSTLTLSLVQPVKSASPQANGNIVFDSNRDGNWEIYSMDSRGESFGLTRLTFNSSNDWNPDWQAISSPYQPVGGGILPVDKLMLMGPQILVIAAISLVAVPLLLRRKQP